ncbi:tRNA (guanosine(37)-N1)-methyltransferase TrmD [Fidelibacter multiformis]|jgi:tRNA (guanine37-N1)-methyltransferase|uniref:tRNA (guanosine(37)-N1)-methyltransferase TrmD n=1 Tax=Fidelibacter multiformis TaxID=3377529 RepID=UPI0037DDD363
MKIDVLTTFPDMLVPVIESSIARIAAEKGIVSIEPHDIRSFSENKHGKTDDYPFGGGDGMVMTPQPLFSGIRHCLDNVKPEKPRIIFPTPDGVPFSQDLAEDLAQEPYLLMICGHYKGIDQRVRDVWVTDEISIGDYVLTGGEIASLVIIDAVIRLIPGVIGTLDSALSDSFSHPLLDCPWYTRPEVFEDLKVPDVLLSGHHARIETWRQEERIKKTRERRPDLYHKWLSEQKKD